MACVSIAVRSRVHNVCIVCIAGTHVLVVTTWTVAGVAGGKAAPRRLRAVCQLDRAGMAEASLYEPHGYRITRLFLCVIDEN